MCIANTFVIYSKRSTMKNITNNKSTGFIAKHMITAAEQQLYLNSNFADTAMSGNNIICL